MFQSRRWAQSCSNSSQGSAGVWSLFLFQGTIRNDMVHTMVTPGDSTLTGVFHVISYCEFYPLSSLSSPQLLVALVSGSWSQYYIHICIYMYMYIYKPHHPIRRDIPFIFFFEPLTMWEFSKEQQLHRWEAADVRCQSLGEVLALGAKPLSLCWTACWDTSGGCQICVGDEFQYLGDVKHNGTSIPSPVEDLVLEFTKGSFESHQLDIKWVWWG